MGLTPKNSKGKWCMADDIKGFFSELEQRIDPKRTAGITAVFQFIITGDESGEWFVEFADGVPSVQQGTHENPNLSLMVDGKDWLDIVNGKQNAQVAFLTGKLKLRGDLALAMKVQSLLG